MKSNRAIVMIGLSIAAGLVAVVLAARWMGEQESGNTTMVVVAARDLELGAPLSAVMLQETPWPTSAIPEGSFKATKLLEGRVVRSPVFKGEPVLEGRLAPSGTKGGLPSIISDGKRAISVKVNEVVGVAGFALPGSFVDVLINTNDFKDKAVSKIVLRRILVLAVAQEANRDDTKPKVANAVTLEVTPEQAEMIDLARSIGTLSLVLRNPIDRLETSTQGVRREDLLALSAEVVPQAPLPEPPAVRRPVVKPMAVVAKPPPAAAKVSAVEVIRGVQKADFEF